MRPIIAVAAMLIAAPTPAPVHAAIRDIMPGCREAVEKLGTKQTFSIEATRCLYYVGGFAEVFTSGLLNWPACPGKETSTGDVFRVFTHWAQRHPDVWHEEEIRGLMAAITEFYPCPPE